MIRKIRALANANIQTNMIYKVNFLIGTISTLILFSVHFNLWNTIYKVSNTNIIRGFALGDMIAYVAVARILHVFVNSLNFDRKVANEIKTGTLSVYLVKPMNYFVYNMSLKLGNMILQFGVSLTAYVVLLLFVLKNNAVVPSIQTFALVLFTAILGMLINTLIGYVIALMALWVEHVDIVFVFKGLFLTFISGVLIPISFFPEILKTLLNYLPFKYLISFPIDVYLGKVASMEIISGIVFQFAWIIILYFTSKLMWNKGIKKYSSVGG